MRLAMHLLLAILCLLAPGCSRDPGVSQGPEPVGFTGALGLQLYSLRDQFAEDVPSTLEKVRSFGIEYVELAGTYNLSPGEFKEQLDAGGLKPVSGHFSFERLRDDAEGVARDAKALGLEYVGCAWIPHKYPFDEKTCREAIAV